MIMAKISKTTLTVSFTFTVLLLSQTITPAFAQDFGIGGLVHDVNGYRNQASHAAAMQQRKLADIIQHADAMITNRITHLNTLLGRVQSDTRLTSDEKTNLSGQIQTVISGLTSLKSKVDADTDAKTALTDAKQMFTNFHVYEQLEPKIRLLIMLNNMLTMVTKVQGLVPQLQTLINNLSSQGKDVSGLKPLISDVSTQLQTITTTLTNDITTVQNISLSSSNSDTSFQQVKSDVQTIVKTDFQKIKEDIEQMRPIFRQLILPGDHPSGVGFSPSVTPSITATPTATH